MLLIGIWRHGMQRWAAIANDERLNLKEKLAQAAQEKLAKEPHNAPGLEHLPRGTHLETRVAGLLKRMVRARASIEAKAAREAKAAVEGKARAAAGDGGGAGIAAAADASLPPQQQQQQQQPALPVPPLSPAEITLSESLQRSVDAVAALRASGGDVDAALKQLGAQVRTRASTSPGRAGEAGIWALVAIKIAASSGGAPEETGWTGAELQARVDALFEGSAAGFAAPASSPPVPAAATKREEASHAAAPAAPAPVAASAAVPEVEMEEAEAAEEKEGEEVQAPAALAVQKEEEEVAAPVAAAVSPAAPPATTDTVMAPVAAAAPAAAAVAPGGETAAATAPPPPPPPQQQADDGKDA